MPMSKEWVVTMSPERPIGHVARDLTESGFSIERIFGELRCITGFVSQDLVDKLRTIPGVIDVSPRK